MASESMDQANYSGSKGSDLASDDIDSPNPDLSDATNSPKMQNFPGFPPFFGGNVNMLPVMYPVLVPAPNTTPTQEEEVNNGAGIYAVPVLPFMGMGPVAGIPSNTLIPLTYRTPTRSQAGAVEGQQSQGGQQQQQPQHPQQPALQRQAGLRRFQLVFHVDLLLILKLAAVIFIFNQDGSRQRLALLVFLASIVYLYQTGALTPLMRWVSQAMQRAAAPPRTPRPPARAEPAPREAHDNVPAAAEGQPGLLENDNQAAADDHNQAENEPLVEPAAVEGGRQWWGIMKEIQMIVFGFITSLLPGFHNIDHAA